MTDPFGRFEGYLNTRGGMSRGVELSGEWAVNTSLTVNGSYTYTDARERTPLIPGVYRTLGIPKHQVTTFAVQRFGKHAYAEFALNAASNYLAEMYSADFTGGAYRFPGYKRADVGLSYQRPVTEALSIRFFGKAQNIFNQNYYEAGFPTGGITARGGLQFEF
jgi:outer membrane receptor protein involved in Fe transport